MPESTPTSRRLWIVMFAAIVLVLFRSIVFLCYEQNFDSDQAIVGLMAKHLSEFRSVPLFFYGQNYMLGVEAWQAVPFFWLGGPTVTMLRLPLVLLNIALTIVLLRLLCRYRLDPVLAFVAVLPIAACGPVASAQLLTALGASVEPLVYVVALWLLRRRPVAFGVLLAIGALHREFTLFAVPALAVVAWRDRRMVPIASWRGLAQSAGGFAATWLVIDQIRRHANITGPSSAVTAADGQSLALEAVHVARILSFHPSIYLARLRLLLAEGLPDLAGGRSRPLFVAGIWGDGTIGWRIAGIALAAAAGIAAARLLWIAVRGRSAARPFHAYLAIVGLEALAAYGLHGGGLVEDRTELNYVLLALLLAVGLFAAYLQSETRPRLQRAVVGLIVAWAAMMTVDNARVTWQYLVNPPPSPHRTLADYLTEHRVKYASAGYWDAYRVTFLSRERVIVASDDIVRVPAYQARVAQNQGNAARIVRVPCDGGTRVAEWCVFDPFNR